MSRSGVRAILNPLRPDRTCGRSVLTLHARDGARVGGGIRLERLDLASFADAVATWSTPRSPPLPPEHREAA